MGSFLGLAVEGPFENGWHRVYGLILARYAERTTSGRYGRVREEDKELLVARLKTPREADRRKYGPVRGRRYRRDRRQTDNRR